MNPGENGLFGNRNRFLYFELVKFDYYFYLIVKTFYIISPFVIKFVFEVVISWAQSSLRSHTFVAGWLDFIAYQPCRLFNIKSYFAHCEIVSIIVHSNCFICTQLNCFNISYLHKVKRVKCFIWSIDRILTPSLGGPGSNGNEGFLLLPQSSRTIASSSDGLVS